MELIARQGAARSSTSTRKGGESACSTSSAPISCRTRATTRCEANERLGFKPDLRDFGIGAQILRDLGLSTLRVMTNNPRKLVGLEGYGLEIVERVPLIADTTPENQAYLDAKRDKLGHLFAH